MIARRAAPCPICQSLIFPGEHTRPLSAPNDLESHSSPSRLWSHLTCVAADDLRVPVCKHWLRRGVCIYSANCVFRHDEASKAAQACDSKRRGVRKRLRVFNEGRAGVVRRWLMRVFGEEYLASGSGVVEVAGGKGELSFELLNLNGVSSCVWDPRPLELRR